MTLTLARDDLLPGRNFIAAWRDAREGRRLPVSDLATDTVFAWVPDSGGADARAAVDAAHAAFAHWRLVPARQRAHLLKRWNDLVLTHQDDLGTLISRSPRRSPRAARWSPSPPRTRRSPRWRSPGSPRRPACPRAC